MMDHMELVHEAKAAIDRVFSDRSVSRLHTRDSLIELRDEIEIILDTLKGEDE